MNDRERNERERSDLDFWLLIFFIVMVVFGLMAPGCNVRRQRAKTPAAPTGDPDAPFRWDWGEWKTGCSKKGNKFRWRLRGGHDIGRESNIKGIYHWIDYHAENGIDEKDDLFQSSVKNDKGEWVDVQYTGLGGVEECVRFYVELKPPVPRVRCKECGRFLEDHRLTREKGCVNVE